MASEPKELLIVPGADDVGFVSTGWAKSDFDNLAEFFTGKNLESDAIDAGKALTNLLEEDTINVMLPLQATAMIRFTRPRCCGRQWA